MRFPFSSQHAPIAVVVANGDGTYGYVALAGVVNADGITASLAVSGGSSGGGGATGSVTAAGTNGTLAQAVQGINGGVPLPVTGAFYQSTQPISNAFLSNQSGTYGYTAGTNGTVTVPASSRVIGVTAYSASGGTVTINGGATITIPAGGTFADDPLGALTGPTYVFSSGVTSYFVEWLT